MIEFVVGLVLGVWAAQQFPLPSVHIAIQNWWSAKNSEQQVDEVITEDNDSAPIFSGSMPSV